MSTSVSFLTGSALAPFLWPFEGLDMFSSSRLTASASGFSAVTFPFTDVAPRDFSPEWPNELSGRFSLSDSKAGLSSPFMVAELLWSFSEAYSLSSPGTGISTCRGDGVGTAVLLVPEL
uniref:(northern house mosquito) hypothetical protein n=1 Tax=Culex pipiens TaxID=7175 RepID=A0A8D8BJ50_CULPI